MAHQITLLNNRVRTLEKANIRLAKRRRAKRSRVQLRGALSIEDSQAIIEEKQKGKRPAGEISSSAEEAVRGGPSKQQYSNCGKTGHYATTCQKDVEGSSQSDSKCIIVHS
jgi:hypothetical protein